MAKYKRYNYSQTVMLPVSLDDQLMPGTIEFAIHTLVEDKMDMLRFDERYKNDDTGRSAYDPKVLLKIVLLAYARGIFTSRKIERVCKENVVFMALSCGQEPDHSTIAPFVSSLQEEIVPLFRDVLLVCDEMNLLGGTEFALDGLKLPSNASKKWSGTIGNLKRKKEKLENKVRLLLTAQIEADRKEEVSQGENEKRKRQAERLKKEAERIEKWLSENEAKIGKQGGEIQSNVTDNDSAKMLTSHGTIQGYNAQALVDKKHQIIIQGEASGSGQDHHHIPPVIDEAKENMKALDYNEEYFEGATFTADSNYHSEVNIKKCVEEGLDAYIPDKDFRSRDPQFEDLKERYKSKKERKFKLEDFSYDEERDHYICPQGEVLRRTGKRLRYRDSLYRRYAGKEGYCGGCVVKRLCIKNKGGKYKCLMVFMEVERRNYSKEMVAKIDTERGRELYPHRIAIVEPVFANIRTNKRLDRFTLRGKIKVNIQWLLYCMVHNIEKIANFGSDFALV
jgi:transposase/IS5 family transposase